MGLNGNDFLCRENKVKGNEANTGRGKEGRVREIQSLKSLGVLDDFSGKDTKMNET